jgi:Zn-finger protein
MRVIMTGKQSPMDVAKEFGGRIVAVNYHPGLLCCLSDGYRARNGQGEKWPPQRPECYSQVKRPFFCANPHENAFVESFNGTLRAECLDTHWFGTLEEAKETIEAWRREYNESRPHRALGERTPNEFAHEIAARRDLMGSQTAENSP